MPVLSIFYGKSRKSKDNRGIDLNKQKPTQVYNVRLDELLNDSLDEYALSEINRGLPPISIKKNPSPLLN